VLRTPAPLIGALAVATMYLRTDEELEAAEALRMAARMASECSTNATEWRWVIISLHQAVQGFMVLSLRHGNGLLALSPDSFAEWMEAHEKRGPYPRNEKLDSYLGLYNKVKSKDLGTLGSNRRFEPKGTEGRGIRMLSKLRNEFIHFTPKGWSLEIDGLPQICLDALRIVEFLGWETENIYWHEPEYKLTARKAAYDLKKNLELLKGQYASGNS
jgi:hypothetical protein